MKQRLLLVVLVLAALMLACNMPAAPGVTPTGWNNQTIDPRTALAAQTQTPTTPGTLVQTITPGGAVQTTAPGSQATATTACDQAQFVADVTVPDGTKFQPGEAFTKTWRLRNTGACTWTPSYAVVFTGGDAMSAPAVVSFSGSVPPGAVVDITINMKAPNVPGKYYSDWMLRNAAGQLFGVVANQPFFLQIEVISNITPTVTSTPTITITPIRTGTPTVTPPVSGTVYDFAANVCKAEWRSQAGVLDCPGASDDKEGYVMKLENPRLETGAFEGNPVILTQPQLVQDGAITGRFPVINIQSGYHFTATLGCLSGMNSCSVVYQLNYLLDSSEPVNLGQWEQVYDGSVQGIDVDLSSLAGKNVQIVLVVLSKGSANQDQAVWVNPRIIKQ